MTVHLLGDEGHALLAELRELRTLYAFDFDGTLCPIVDRREEARLAPQISEALDRLACVSPVAVISGRSIEDLEKRIDCRAVRLVGNHGAEGALPSAAGGDSLELCRQWAESLAGGAADVSGIVGVQIEQKRLSISLHYRDSPDREGALASLFERIEKLGVRPRVIPGKCVLNLVPRASPHKGDALLALMKVMACERALFVGDDVTDEDIFRLKDQRIHGARVEVDPGSGASFYLRDQGEVLALLEELSH